MNNNVAVKVENVTKVYRLYDKPQDRLKEALNPFKKSYHHDFYALHDVSFEMKKGETVGIIGRNGAGKSTLLKIITGVLTPTNGNVEVNGKIASLLELGAGFNPEMTGLENIYLNGTLMGFTHEEMEGKVDTILEFADIGSFIYQPVKTYSSGMFARLAFSVAIHVEPDILIVDEALSVGDVFFQQKCNLYMKENMSNIAKIIVTHDLATLSKITTRAILIDNGKKIIEGEPISVIEVYQKLLHNSLFNKGIKRKVETKMDTNIQDFISIKKDNQAGSMDAYFEKFNLTINDRKNSNLIVYPKDKVVIDVLIQSNIKIENLILGYIIKDKYGTAIFGENTITSDLSIDEKNLVGKLLISFSFSWPEIQEGDYFLTLGLGDGTDSMFHTILSWAHSICKFKSVLRSGMIVHCMMNNKINRISLKKVK